MTPRGSTNRDPQARASTVLRRSRRGAPFLAALLLAAPALAQTQPTLRPSATAQTATPAGPGDRRAALRAELDGVLRDIDLGKQRQATITADIEALGRDRGRLASELSATADRLRDAERRLAVTEKRIGDLDRDLARSRAALEARRGVLADVLAALQRIGRNPPPALVVRPRDALASVRSAILVGALLPELRDQAEALLADLQSLQALQASADAERERFRNEATDLVGERERLRALIDERTETRTEREASLAAEHRRTAELAARAGSLRDLLATLDRAATPPPATSPGRAGATMAGGRGALPLPLVGETVLRFGEIDAAGLGSKGLSIAARPAAVVTSPCDGVVIFSGPFRSYGKLLIINGGAGYHVLLAGMDRIDVEIGQSVSAGEPVGFMGVGFTGVGPGTTIAGRPGEDRPVLYVEFRKDGTPIDPSPWWATARDEKVRG